MNRAKYDWYVNQGICVRCRKNMAIKGRTRCFKCREKEAVDVKEEYWFYKNKGICTHCHKNKAEKGKTRCLVCMMDDRERITRQVDKEERKKYDAMKRKERIEKGLCSACGKEKQQHGLLCYKCWHKAKSRRKPKYNIPRSEYTSFDMCYICGSTDLVEGKKVCKKCYEVRLKAIYIPSHMTLEQKKLRKEGAVEKAKAWKKEKLKIGSMK